jgi:hypothetical protein
MPTAENVIVVTLVPVLALFVIPRFILKISTRFPSGTEPKPDPPKPDLGIDLALAIYEYRRDHPEVR